MMIWNFRVEKREFQDMPLPTLPEPPLVAILRGVRPDEVIAIGHALISAGFRSIEVPMNSPNAIESIALLVNVELFRLPKSSYCIAFLELRFEHCTIAAAVVQR